MIEDSSHAAASAEFRISPAPVFAALPVLAVLLYMLGEAWTDAHSLFPYILFALSAYLTAGVGWWVWARWPAAGRIFAACSLTVACFLPRCWLDIHGSLALVAASAPAVLAMLGLPAAFATLLAESAALAGLYGLGVIDLPSFSLALIVAWSVAAAVTATHLPVQDAARRSWDYFHRAQDLLEEARNRQGELGQALEDLAHANQQLNRLNALAQGLRQAAEDARMAKEQFVANVSHELRTPLNMIIGFSEMIVETPETYGGGVPAALLADLAVIRRNAEHLAALINDVLDLSQIEADQMALTKEYVSIHEVVGAATEAVRPLYDSKHLRLEVEMPPADLRVFCDRTRIREVLLNLLSNAGRFTERGGVVVRVRQEKDDLAVSVTDTGPGIAAEDMQKLFQPFQQIDNSIRRRYGGTGLGLSISKRFIELHDGRIWVESEKSVGTAFHFTIPLTPLKPTQGNPARWLIPEWDFLRRTHPSANPRGRVQARLVVLEQGDSLQRMLRRYLGDIEVVPVTELDTALAELAATPSQALLINDVSVSGALQRLEGTPLPYGVPVLTCSIPATDESARALGISGYLVKPIAKKALLGALARLDLPTKTVLIVDDEPEALRLFQRMLHSAGQGYHVLRAKNGQEGLQLLRERRPDVVLLDMVMPTMDGFQLLEAKSQDPALAGIPAIVISARDPLGQPIVSNGLAVTRHGGLSAHALLGCIRAITQILALPGAPADLKWTTTPLDESVC
jgi:signal transduction histidine kinase/CheY-like chemotaxis protein